MTASNTEAELTLACLFPRSRRTRRIDALVIPWQRFYSWFGFFPLSFLLLGSFLFLFYEVLRFVLSFRFAVVKKGEMLNNS